MQVLVLGVLVTHARPLKESLTRHRAAKAFDEDYLLKFGNISESCNTHNSALQRRKRFLFPTFKLLQA